MAANWAGSCIRRAWNAGQLGVADRATGGGYGTGELGRGYPHPLRAKSYRLITLIHTIHTAALRFGPFLPAVISAL